ncbi:GRAM domain-containing protein [Schizosaccharomyces pombe]
MKEENGFAGFLNTAVNRLSGVLNDTAPTKSQSLKNGVNNEGNRGFSLFRNPRFMSDEKLSSEASSHSTLGQQQARDGRQSPSKEAPFGEGELKLENFENQENEADEAENEETSYSEQNHTENTEEIAEESRPLERTHSGSNHHEASSTGHLNLPPLENTLSQGSAITAPSRKVSITSSNGVSARLSGYAFANSKRNRDFHRIFKVLPPEDHLIDDYGCALQRDIFLHGRMYLSESHICFNSSIFGWVTNIVIPVTEIVSVEKKSTAVVFPNAIQITTLHARYIFASFISRDTTYQLIIAIWKNTHPFLTTLANGHGVMDASGNHHSGSSNQSINADSSAGSEGIDEGTSTEANDESSEDDDEDNNTDEANEDAQSNVSDESPKGEGSSHSDNVVLSDGNSVKKMNEDGADTSLLSVSEVTSHPPTEWTGSPLAHVLCSDVVNLSVSTVFNLLCGSDTTWIINFFKSEKLTEIKIGKWEKIDDKWNRKVQYIKPVAPPYRQTSCYITDTIQHLDINNYIEILSTTSTPDVPSGTSFVVKTLYALSWAHSSKTKLNISYSVEWSKSSWLKGPIEKGAQEGQASYVKDLLTAFENYKVSPKGRRKKITKHTKKKNKHASETSVAPEKVDNSSIEQSSSFLTKLYTFPFTIITWLMHPTHLLLVVMFSMLVLQWWYMQQILHAELPSTSSRSDSSRDLDFDHIPMDDTAFKLWITSRLDSVERDRDFVYENSDPNLEHGKIKIATDYMERRLKKLKERLRKLEASGYI